MLRVVKIFIEEPLDGGIRVYSDELPGLILSGPNKAKIISAIEPAIRTLLAMKGERFDDLRIDALIPAKRSS